MSVITKSPKAFQIKHCKLNTNESPQSQKAKAKIDKKLSNEEEKLSNIRNTSSKKISVNMKATSISPSVHLEKKIIYSPQSPPSHNNKKLRSISIYTEENMDNHEKNFMKNEELMQKILQPLNCESLSQAKKITELKGFFKSLIMVSPTKHLNKINDFSPVKNTFSRIKKKK